MFQVNRVENRLLRLAANKFAELDLREREHLQEWLANQPDALGEELLVIQKEFDGFSDTRERLDLLALDKKGHLVVIENKLDDSGRDVAWQALKYTAYVSGFTKKQIVDIFQAYLDQHYDGGNAVQKICEFMEVEELDEVVLNPGNDQRVMLVAANFRKEVTSTVLWLCEHNIDARCFKVVPYSFEEKLFLDIQQIIPTPEAEDFMIGMAKKEIEQRSDQNTNKGRHKLRLDFWEQVLETLRASGQGPFQNISPSRENWLHAGSGVQSCPFQMIFGRTEARVELYLQRQDKSENKMLFDKLYEQKQTIEASFGEPLTWRRLDDKKVSRIICARPFDGFNRDNWPEMIHWLQDHITRLESAFREPLAHLNQSLRAKRDRM